MLTIIIVTLKVVLFPDIFLNPWLTFANCDVAKKHINDVVGRDCARYRPTVDVQHYYTVTDSTFLQRCRSNLCAAYRPTDVQAREQHSFALRSES